MRTYSKVDMIQFVKLSKEHPDLKPWALIKLYDETVKELTGKEKYDNLMRALGLDMETLSKVSQK